MGDDWVYVALVLALYGVLLVAVWHLAVWAVGY